MTLNTDTLQVGGVNVVSSSGVVLPPSQLKTYTPTIEISTGIGSMSDVVGYYISLGPLKLLWARCLCTWGNVTSTGNATISIPSGFFTSIQNVQIHLKTSTTIVQGVVYRGGGTTLINFILFSPSGGVMPSGSACQVNISVMGT